MQVIAHRGFRMTLLKDADPLAALKAAAPLLPTMWLGVGTLLGVVRENDFIPYDTDIDFMAVCDWEDGDTSLCLPEPEYELLRTMEHEGRPMQRAYIKDEVIIDVEFFWRGLEDGVVVHEMESGTMRIPEELIEPIQPFTFKGVQVNLPADPEGWLEHWYGPNWRTPNPKWRACAEPYCLERTR